MEDCFLEIFKYLNYNDKASCRLVCHQFKRLIDSMLISKLVVFHRSPIEPGKFALINEQYGEYDCVYVFNLKTFFANEFILQRLGKIEKLVINGSGGCEFSLNAIFKNLTHLELRNVYISSPTILLSPNIKTLFLDDAELNHSREDYFNGVLGFNSLEGKLKHFSHSSILCTEMDFYKSCVQKRIFSELETLDCYVNELETLLFIGDNFTNLKVVNVRIAKSRDDFIDLLDRNPFGPGKLVKRLRSDLKVNFFGMPLNKLTRKSITDFILEYGLELRFYPGRMSALVSDDMITFQNKNPELATGFLEQVDSIRFEDRLKNESLSEKFTNVSEACYNFWLEVRHNLPERFKAHPNITSLILTSLPDGHYLNDIMDMIPVNFENLTNLHMDQWDDANFDFFLKLPKMKTLKLLIRNEFNQELFIEILRSLKYLSSFEAFYERTDIHTKDYLSSFKKSVLACLHSELKYTDCVFKIELHHRESYMGNEKFSFVRYILKRTLNDSKENSLSVSENDIRKMMWCIGYKRDHPESSIEHDTEANMYRRRK